MRQPQVRIPVNSFHIYEITQFVLTQVHVSLNPDL